MSRVLVVAPHPDDETLGCGGTLLRHGAEGDQVHWLIVTAMTTEAGFSAERIAGRQKEIEAVAAHYHFSGVHELGLSTTRLDSIPKAEIVGRAAEVFHSVEPGIVYLPFRGDAHDDHSVAFDACVSCTKWFRQPSVKRIRAYETLSETEFGLSPETSSFRPNLFVNITDYLDGKIMAMGLYAGEMEKFPFPRSEEAIRALAMFRGSSAGFRAAEAFITIKEIL